MNVAQRAASSLRWQALASVVTQVVQSGSVLFVASRVAPESYALWGLASVLFNVQHLIGVLGLGPALVYLAAPAERWRETYGSALTTTVLIASTVCALLVAGAVPFAWSGAIGLDRVSAAAVIWVMATVLFLQAVVQIPQAALERSLRFRQRAQAELAGTATGLLVVVGTWLLGTGVWSLVFGKLGQTAVTLAVTTVATRLAWLPDAFEPDLLRPLVSFGGAIGLGAIVGLVFSNLDTMLSGVLFGPGALGAYALAYSLAVMVPTALSIIVGRVYFSVLSACRHDPREHARVVRDLTHLVGLGIAPVTVVLVGLGPPLVVRVFGSEWSLAGSLMPWLAVYGLARTASLVASCALSSTGRTWPLPVADVTGLATALVAIALLHDAGPWAVAASFTVGQLAGTSVLLAVARRFLGASVPVLAKVGALAAASASVIPLIRPSAGAVGAALASAGVFAASVAVFDRGAIDLVAPGRPGGGTATQR